MAPPNRQSFEIEADHGPGQRVARRRRGAGRPLSRRQQQVVSCLALGLPIDEVARQLGIARATAVQHRTLAGLTLGLVSLVELTHYALLQGWIQVGDALSAERVDGALRRIMLDSAAEAVAPPSRD